ncbi:hypothetical protein [Streptomyces sp. AP-93]|uniref:hypothetical protein n=1 Tax=Streptomyces sp. AP-93 TaxID=2929048 RepID=UPI001FAEE667|nr:hypothetical protein [Streptomyces sp. AP-93]MCJ0874593.1 hypothetical protein [Streptomyces sp. AP-93]
MSGGQPDLDASKEALGSIAQGITQTLGELKEIGMVGTASMGRGFANLALSTMDTGHDGLSSTFRTFCERWEWGVRSLVQQGNNFAENVGLSAGALHEQDQYVQGTFKVVANAAMGNPYASEGDITGKGWGEVLADNPYTQIRDADYSKESFDHASVESKDAWKGAIHDVNSSDILLSNQIIDAAGLRDEMDRTVEGIAGPAPKPDIGGDR